MGKSESCLNTALSGALDKPVLDGITISLKISEENDKHRYLFIGGDMVCSILTNDKIYKYISNMGKNLVPYSIAIGEENIFFMTPHFEYSKKQNFKNVDLMEPKKNL